MKVKRENICYRDTKSEMNRHFQGRSVTRNGAKRVSRESLRLIVLVGRAFHNLTIRKNYKCRVDAYLVNFETNLFEDAEPLEPEAIVI